MEWGWAENVGAALAAIAVGYCVRACREWITSRRGKLAGYWLWITYDNNDGCIWSVEVVQLSHRRTPRKDDRLSGTVWRLYDRSKPHHWKRRWSFVGWHIDGVIEGVYKSTRDEDGSHGVIHVWRTDMGYDGIYVRLVREHAENNQLSTMREENPTEWRRLPNPLPSSLQQVVDSIPSKKLREFYPWRVRRKLRSGPQGQVRVLGGFPYAAALVDNRLALEQTREQLRPTGGSDGGNEPLLRREDLELPSHE